MIACVSEVACAFGGRNRLQHQYLLDVGEEGGTVHRAIDHIGRGHPIGPACGDERQRFPVAVRNLRDQTLTHRRTAIEARHLRRHRGFVDEHETRGFQSWLLGLQLLSRGSDIRPILLGRVQDFF